MAIEKFERICRNRLIFGKILLPLQHHKRKSKQKETYFQLLKRKCVSLLFIVPEDAVDFIYKAAGEECEKDDVKLSENVKN